MKGFLDYLQGDSILHKMHPLTKIFVAALLCASAFVTSEFFKILLECQLCILCVTACAGMTGKAFHNGIHCTVER